MSGEQMTKSWGGAKVRTQNGEFEVLSRPFMLIKENIWRIGQHLINNQYDQHASDKTKVDFARKLDTALRLQGAESPGVLQFPSPHVYYQ